MALADWVASLVCACVLAVIVLLMKGRLQRIGRHLGGAKSALAMLYVLGMGVVVYYLSGLHTQVRTAYAAIDQTYQAFAQELAEQRDLKAKFGDLEWQGAPPSPKFEGTLILVLGESTTRNHMGIYGYPRETTPVLESLRGDLLVQRDTISPHSHTVQSLSEVLSVANYDDGIKFAQHPDKNLLSGLEAAGFKTFWLSNQNKYGIWDNLVSLIGQSADEVKFIRKSFGKVYHFKSYDDELLPLLREAMEDPERRKFIVLHLYATHWDYCSFVPREELSFAEGPGLGRAFFGNAPDRSRTVNCYDDAVRYVDSILGEVIAQADAADGPVGVVYLSDHGEDPAGGTGHEAPLHRGTHVEVPHIWHFNDQASRLVKREIDAFRNNSTKPFKSSDFFHTVMDLMAESSSPVRADRSLFSETYEPYSRTTMVSDDGKELVKYDEFGPSDKKGYFEKARASLLSAKRSGDGRWRKLWAHRVDSLGKLLEAKRIFSGVELDLVYEPALDRFFVYHPPASSTGLALDRYLEASDDVASLGYWLDWKNASAVEVVEAVKRLDELDRRFHFRERAILELPSDFAPEDGIVKAMQGWRTAFYMPTDDILACAEQDAPGCAALANRIAATAASMQASYLSFDYRAKKFVSAYRERFIGYDLISWDLSRNAAVDDMGQVDIDPDISIFLVGYPSLYHY